MGGAQRTDHCQRPRRQGKAAFPKPQGNVQIATISPVTAESISPKVDIGIDQLQVIQTTVANLIPVDGMVLKLSGDVFLRLFASRGSDAVDVIVALEGFGTTGSNQRL